MDNNGQHLLSIYNLPGIVKHNCYMLYILATDNVVYIAQGSPGSLLDMWILRPSPHLLNQNLHFFFLKSILSLFFFFFGCVGSSLLHWLSLVAANRGYSSLWCAGFSLWWLLLLRSTGSKCVGFNSCSVWAQ